jgi:hypothetical protein
MSNRWAGHDAPSNRFASRASGAPPLSRSSILLSTLLLSDALLSLLYLLDALRIPLLLCPLLALLLLSPQLVPLLFGCQENLLLFGKPQIPLLHHPFLLDLIPRLPGRIGVPLLLALILAVFRLLFILLPLGLLLTIVF